MTPPGTEPLGETVAAADKTLVAGQARGTVLPRREGGAAAAAQSTGRRFRHVKPLGEGGMGEVVLALDEDIQRRVAIKRIRQDQSGESTLLRFADEVRIIGQLEHPGIVPVHDVGVDDDGQLYLVMKFVEGDTLERILEGLRAHEPAFVERYPVTKRVEVLGKILEALSYAHSRGFVHRDLKPANIMVGPHGEVTLMDWGIAKQIGQAEDPAKVDALAATGERRDRLVETQAGTLLGTILYMSPEQAAGKNSEVDARSDVFAAGLVAVELLTLEHPLGSLTSAPAVLATLLHHDLDGRANLQPFFAKAGVGMELMWFTSGALARDPAKRYADAGAMVERLRRLQGGDIPIQCPVSLTKAVTSSFIGWVDRHVVLWVGIMTAGAIAVAAGLVVAAVVVVRAIAH